MMVRKAKPRAMVFIVAIAGIQNGEGVAVAVEATVKKTGGEEVGAEKEGNIVKVAVGAKSVCETEGMRPHSDGYGRLYSTLINIPLLIYT